MTDPYAIPFADNGMNQYNNVGGVPVGYDGNFNLTNFNGGLTFNYDAESQLVSGSMSCTYDGLGRCVRRTVGGVTKLFTYDDWKPFLEWDGSGNWIAWNIYGAGPDEILARYDVAGRVSIYKQDQHGNVTFVLNQFGNVVEKYTYDAFGKPTIFDAYGNVLSQSAVGNRFMYTGREWIPELGIYDYRHRMYHPGLGRFLQMDPTGFDAGDMNLFRYCDDDPVDGSDPTGLLNMWGNLEKFYSGNPSMKVVQDAWNERRSGGLMMAQMSSAQAPSLDPRLNHLNIPDTISKLDAKAADYARRFPEYPDGRAVVNGLKKALREGRIRPGERLDFKKGNPVSSRGGIILVDIYSRVNLLNFPAHLAHDGEHIVDNVHENDKGFMRERRAYDVQDGFAAVTGSAMLRVTDKQISGLYHIPIPQ